MKALYISAIVCSLLSFFSCGDSCIKYKKLACKNRNAKSCHAAMQDMEKMSVAECEERIGVLDSIREMEARQQEIEIQFSERFKEKNN